MVLRENERRTDSNAASISVLGPFSGHPNIAELIIQHSIQPQGYARGNLVRGSEGEDPPCRVQ